jgi:alpha-mannosidase
MTEIHEDLSRSPEWLARIEHEGQQSGVFAALMFYGVGDRGGAPLEKSVEWLEKSIAGTGPIRVVSSPPDALFRTLAPDQIARLPRYRGELLLTTHGTGVYTSQAAMKRWNRRNELLADAAERASVVADWLGGSPYPRGKLTEAWTRFLWHQFHDDLPGTCIPRAYTISWNDEIISLNQFSEVAADAAGAVARGLDTRGEGATVVVYNPLSILREDPVEALVRMPGHMPPAVRVYDAEGHEVASQVLGTEGDAVRILFLAEVAPVGFAVYDVRAAETPCALQTGLRVSESSVENDRYVVRISPGGDVSSLRDKEANRELLAGPLRLQMFDDRSITWPAWEIMRSDIDAAPRRLVGGPAKVRIVENGPARVALEIEREVEGSTFIQRVRLASGGSEARVEFDTTLQWKSLGTLLKATFPLTVANPLATYDLGWGAVERTTNTPKLYEVPNDCKYGWDKPADQTLRLTLLHTPVTGPESYTDQATQDIGRHRLLYAVCGHKGDWRSAVPWEAARMNQPLLAFQAPMHEGPLGKTFSLVSLDTPQVAVRAIKKAELTDEVIIRLVETAGRPAQDVHVSFCGGLLGAREVNGSEQPVGPAAIEDGDLVADFTPYQPRTFAVKLTAPPARLEAPVSRPLPLALDLDVVSADNEQKGGDFDGSGHAIPAELWPPAIVSEGIQFALGSRAAGTKNALACTGQQIALPQGTHQHLYLLAAAAGPDDVKAAFLVDDRPVDLTIQSWTGLVGQWDSRVVGGQVVEDLSRIAPAFLKRDPIAWVGTHRHDKDGKNEPYVFCYLFKYRIEVPKNAATLTLPKNDRLRIFAATLVTNPNDDTRPAQWLYD